MIKILYHALLLFSVSTLLSDFVAAFNNNGVIGKTKSYITFRDGNVSVSKPSNFPGHGMMIAPYRIPGFPLQSLPLEETDPIVQNISKSSDLWVFVLGVFPFAWATVEFWRRIMFGEAFGTGSDQIIIGMDDSPSDSRGRRVLGKGALAVAYFLFAASFATLAVVLYAVFSSAPPPEIFPLPDGGQ